MLKIRIKRSVYDDSDYYFVDVKESMPIKDAVDIDFDNAIIMVNDSVVDENYILKEKDVCNICLFPKAVSTPALIAIIVACTIAALAITNYAFKVFTGESLISKIGNALRRWLFNDLNEPNSQEALQNVPQLRGAKNQSNKNKPIPVVLGKHLFTPMFIGTPYTTIDGEDGEDQYYHALYLLGWNDLKVSDIKLGEWSGLAKNADNVLNGKIHYIKDDGFCDPSFANSLPELEIQQSGTEVSLYPQRVVEERLEIELINFINRDNETEKLEVRRFSAQNPEKVQIEITFPAGLIAYDAEGNKKDASVGIRVLHRYNPEEEWRTGMIFGTDVFGNSPTEYIPTAGTGITTIRRQKAKVMRFVAELYFGTNVINQSRNRTVEFMITRESPKPDDNKVSDTVYLTAIRTWCIESEPTSSGLKVIQRPIIDKYKRRTARLGLKIKATENLQGTLNSLNCIVESHARVWNRERKQWSSTRTPTNNPASLALMVMQSPALGGNAFTNSTIGSMVDLESFGEFYEWCEDNNFTCNGVVTNDRKVEDVIDAILLTGRGVKVLNGNRYGVLIDKPRENIVHILNSQNVLEASNRKTFEDLPDGFSIKFINEIDGYQETEVYVMADGTDKPKDDSKLEAIELPFITDYKQVFKQGRYSLACRRLRPEAWIRKVSVDGYLIGIGDKVEIQDDTIAVGIGEGGVITNLVIENNLITEIHTDGTFDITDSTKNYGIKIMQFDGINPGRARTVQIGFLEPGTYSNFTGLTIPLNQTIIPSVGDIISFGEFQKETTEAICLGKKADGEGNFELTLIPYQEGVYNSDLGAIPDYQSNVTNPQGLAPIRQIPKEPATRSDIIELIETIDINGTNALLYDLRPSVNVIIRDEYGVFRPREISCGQVMINGNNLPVPSDLTITYITSKNNIPFLYTVPIVVEDWEWIEFILSRGGLEVDRERVPVLRDGENRIVLDFDNQNRNVLCYHNEEPKEDQLPMVTKATLYHGAREIIENNNLFYPTTGDYLDPMLGDYVIQEQYIKWSLIDPPEGIKIDQSGYITIYDISDFKLINEITVRAVYLGENHESRIRIGKVLEGEKGEKGEDGERGKDAPRYLGKTYSTTTTNEVLIRDTPPTNTSETARRVSAIIDDYVTYLGNTSGIWIQGELMRYTESGWQHINPLLSENTDFYMRALNDVLEGSDNGRFNVLFARKIMTMQATIDELFTHELTILNPGWLQSENYRNETNLLPGLGYKLTSDGTVEMYNARKIAVLSNPDLDIGSKRVYIDNDEVLIQEYEGNNMWRTLITLSLIAGLAALSCEMEETSDVIQSSSNVFVSNPVHGIDYIAYGNGIFVASSNGRVAYSTNGINWTLSSYIFPNIIRKINYSDGIFVASSSGRVAYSTNGINWTSINPLDVPVIAAYGNGIFVVYGSGGGNIAISTDGINWKVYGGFTVLYDIAYGNGIFVASDNGRVAYSTDGINWTLSSNISQNLFREINYSDGIFIAGNYNQQVAYSTDGINWTSINLPKSFYRIAYGNGIFVASGSDLQFAYSTDGINWTFSNSPFDSNITRIAYGDSKFIFGNPRGQLAYTYSYNVNLYQTRFGFTKKHITANSTKLQLSDGNWLNLNNNGSVTWSAN